MWLKHKKIQGFYDVLQVSDCYQDNDDDDDTNFDDDTDDFLCRTGALQKEPMHVYRSG